MIIDAQNKFSREQAVTVSAASENVIDLGSARSIGVATKLDVLITVDVAATAAGAATVTFELQESADNETFTTIAASAAVGKAALTVGGEPVVMTIPAGQSKRYLRLYYTVATGPLTAGKFSAAIVEGLQANKAYPDAL